MDNSGKWGIVYCPRHSDMKRGKRWQQIEKCLNERGIDYDFVQSESVSGVERLVRMMLNNGYQTIVIAGGDSALNDAVNCLMQLENAERSGIALGVIPNSLINDFAHFWGLRRRDIGQAIDTICRRRVKKVDVGCVRYENRQGEKRRRYFVNCVNIGFIAAMMDIRRRAHHVWGPHWLSFLPSMVMLAFQRKDYRMQMKINTDTIDGHVMAVCVGNATGYGQTPNAVPYNGMLDVSVVRQPEIMQMFEGLYLFWRGKFLNHKGVQPYRTRRVDVMDCGKAPVSVDGRTVDKPNGALTITVEAEVINLIIP